jgi:hypothetical protein
VTRDGHDVLSKDAPKEIEIEALMWKMLTAKTQGRSFVERPFLASCGSKSYENRLTS